MGFLDFLTKGSSDTQSLPTTSASQQDLEKALSEYYMANIGKGAEPYGGTLPGMAEVPGLFTKAYSQFESQFGDAGSQQTIRDLISGKPAFTFDPGATTSQWEETYSKPVMQAWRDTVAPMLEEQYNIPGGFYSTRKGLGVGQAANQFYGGQVAPTLFSSLQAGQQMGFQSGEAAASRQPGALGLPGQQFAQAAQVAMSKMGLDEKQLSSLFNEFLRTRAEPGWAAGGSMGLATSGTIENVVTTEPSLMQQLAPIAGVAAASFNPWSGALGPLGF